MPCLVTPFLEVKFLKEDACTSGINENGKVASLIIRISPSKYLRICEAHAEKTNFC
jgi:hypothetical protein